MGALGRTGRSGGPPGHTLTRGGITCSTAAGLVQPHFACIWPPGSSRCHYFELVLPLEHRLRTPQLVESFRTPAVQVCRAASQSVRCARGIIGGVTRSGTKGLGWRAATCDTGRGSSTQAGIVSSVASLADLVCPAITTDQAAASYRGQ